MRYLEFACSGVESLVGNDLCTRSSLGKGHGRRWSGLEHSCDARMKPSRHDLVGGDGLDRSELPYVNGAIDRRRLGIVIMVSYLLTAIKAYLSSYSSVIRRQRRLHSQPLII